MFRKSRSLLQVAQQGASSQGYLLLNSLIGSDAPFQVRYSENAGRGLFATEDIKEGDVIYRSEPVVAHPLPSRMGKVCSHCCKPLPPQSSLGGSVYSALNEYCSEGCASVSKDSYAQVERAAQEYGNLLQYCGERGLKFPLMAHRLAAATLQEHVGLAKGNQFPQQWLRMLAASNPPPELPEEWTRSHSLVVKSLASAFSPGERTVRQQIHDTFNLEWYVATLGRLNLNSFRIETVAPFSEDPEQGETNSTSSAKDTPISFWPPRGSQEGAPPPSPSPSSSSAFAGHVLGQLSSLVGAEKAGSESSSVSGSALYFIPSLFNHSCENAVDVLHPENNAVATFRARRDIGKGEELTITYLDSSMGAAERQAHLYMNYGFRCRCPRCIEGL